MKFFVKLLENGDLVDYMVETELVSRDIIIRSMSRTVINEDIHKNINYTMPLPFLETMIKNFPTLAAVYVIKNKSKEMTLENLDLKNKRIRTIHDIYERTPRVPSKRQRLSGDGRRFKRKTRSPKKRKSRRNTCRRSRKI
jgi:hypothetical protein